MMKLRLTILCLFVASCSQNRAPQVRLQGDAEGFDAALEDGMVPDGGGSPNDFDALASDQGPPDGSAQPVDALIASADTDPARLDMDVIQDMMLDLMPMDRGQAEGDAESAPERIEGRMCPQAWGLRALQDGGEDGWFASGSTDDTISYTEGSCGGGSGQHIYSFIAPTDGHYAIRLNGATFAQLGFAALYVRTSCDEPQTEVACDARREPQAVVSLHLPAQQIVYIFVDGIRSGQFPTTGGYTLQIFRQQPPGLDSAAAWMNPDTASTRVDLDGRLGNVPLAGVVYRFYDLANQVIPVRGSHEPIQLGLVFDLSDEGDGAPLFSGIAEFPSDVPFERLGDVASLDVAVYDQLGGRSDTVRVPVDAPDIVGLGDPCDRVGARSVCPPGTECFIRDPLQNPEPTCHPVGLNCPADWTIIDLNMFAQQDGQWLYDGDLSRRDPPLERHGVGTCPGATGFNDVFSFTAPQRALYRFETGGERGDTILWARRQCGVGGAQVEFACNDDIFELGRFSRIEFQLEADETAYLFVDSFGIDNRAAYRLSATAR